MRLTLVVILLVAYASTKLEAKAVNEAVKNVAEAVVGTATDKVNEIPQVEQKGGLRQQVLHKGVEVVSSSLMKKGSAMVLSSAVKYPLLAAAAPVALPLAKVAVAAIVVNQLHKQINNMGKNKTEETGQAESEKEEGDKQKKNLVEKIAGAFKGDKSEETKETEDVKTKEIKQEEPKVEAEETEPKQKADPNEKKDETATEEVKEAQQEEKTEHKVEESKEKVDSKEEKVDSKEEKVDSKEEKPEEKVEAN